MTTTDERPHVYTIGHSNQSLEGFVRILRDQYIQLLIDVRSYPVSKFAPHFNRPIFEATLPAHAIFYRFAGKQLGGRPNGAEFYDEEGHVLYSKVAEAPFFRDGIEQLVGALPRYRTAIMCSEENPADCHRRLLIGRVLLQRGITLFHVRGTGAVEDESGSTDSEMTGVTQTALPLFQAAEEPSWRSVRPIASRRPPADSASVH